VVLAMLLFRVVAMTPFNFEEAVASLYDVRRTLVQILGPHGVSLTVGTFAALLLACTIAAWVLYRALPVFAARFVPAGPAAVVCVGLLSYFGLSDLVYAAERLVIFPNTGFAQRYIPAPVVHDYSAVSIRPGDSVFIVQLESVNADALFDRAGDESGFRVRVAQPGLETVLREGRGVFFPLFWANGMRTNRAWESVLCAVSGNAGGALAGVPGRLTDKACLPAQLQAAGYATVFFYSYFDLDFYNFNVFAKQAGFQDVGYGPRLMAAGDRRHAWAYDDCVFYNRAFDQLAQRPAGEPVLAYFEVGMNHVPFDEAPKYPEAHPFRPAKSTVENYLNSVAEQDHCLLEFWRRFRELGRDDVHLFVLPDHSVGVLGIPPRVDTDFATWLAYVPPARRAADFPARTVHSPTPSQAQLLPTILELLGAPQLPRSFAFALRGEAAPEYYEDCHMMARQGSNLIVRRNGERAEYLLHTREAVPPGAKPVKLDLAEFQERYACR
jgi:phosphoglycerol transferase MdoB-like AlkP superfamily enzyme